MALQADVPNGHRAALALLLSRGPLRAAAAAWTADQVRTARAVMVAFLRDIVGTQAPGRERGFSGGLTVSHVSFFARADAWDRVTFAAAGEPPAIACMALIIVLYQVGISSVRLCGASDCGRLYIKTHRREFCSERCQKRDYKRRERQTARATQDRAQLRRRRLRATGRV